MAGTLELLAGELLLLLEEHPVTRAANTDAAITAGTMARRDDRNRDRWVPFPRDM
ncbi:hypothetical protein ACIP5Y_40380 [Nocardia sp. NPDC088792]|uniref:hypothetical protein n=1 Tax=Nocardia sp. NPDC088792 TaxID=3364332 RepID=UPI003824260A